MTQEFVMDRHSKLMEVESIAIEAFQKLERSGIDLSVGLILILHHAVIRPSVTHLTPEEKRNLYEYLQGWLDQSDVAELSVKGCC